MKKMITLVLAVSILFTVPVFAAGSAASFSDIPSDYWAYGAVMEMTKQGLFEGTTTPVNGVGTFSPEVTMSCADFVTVVDRALYSTEFSAMAASDPWWKNSYDLAVSKGILKSGELDMSKPMSRQEMALVLSRATSDNLLRFFLLLAFRITALSVQPTKMQSSRSILWVCSLALTTTAHSLLLPL